MSTNTAEIENMDALTSACGQVLNVTPSARVKFAELISQVDDPLEGVRVYLSGGGCSGMQYGMTFADKIHDYDHRLKTEQFDLIIDAVAMNYMDGAEIDYEDDGVNATFVFNNVFQAVGGSGSCGGCGSAA